MFNTTIVDYLIRSVVLLASRIFDFLCPGFFFFCAPEMKIKVFLVAVGNVKYQYCCHGQCLWRSNVNSFASATTGAVVVLQLANCATVPKAHQQHTSEYDENTCPSRCSFDYYPVCGINQIGDTKVFVNDCYMSMENCNQLTQQGNPQLIFHSNCNQ